MKSWNSKIKNLKLPSITLKQVISILILLILASLISWLIIRKMTSRLIASRQSANNILSSEQFTDTKESFAYASEMLKELNKMRGNGEKSNEEKKTLQFEPQNITHIIDNKAVTLTNGLGAVDKKSVILENMILNNDFNNDQVLDFAGIASVTEGGSTSSYLTVVLGGKSLMPIPAKLLAKDYPLITAIAYENNQYISVTETKWKEQKNNNRLFSITKEGITEKE